MIVIQRPVGDRRCSWTPRPANDLAATTRVAKRPVAVRRSETAGRTPTTLAGLSAPAHWAAYDVRIRGFASQRHVPSAAVRTVATDLGEPPSSGCAKIVTLSPARLVGYEPGEQDPPSVDDVERRSAERDAGGGEREVGAARRAGVVPSDEPVVVGRPGPEARKPRADGARRPAGASAPRCGLGAVARRRAVLEPPARRPRARVDRARQRRGRRGDARGDVRAHDGLQVRAERAIAADGGSGCVRRDEAIVVGDARPQPRDRRVHPCRRLSPTRSSDRRPRAVARGRPVVEVPARRLAVRGDRAVQPRRRRRHRRGRVGRHAPARRTSRTSGRRPGSFRRRSTRPAGSGRRGRGRGSSAPPTTTTELPPEPASFTAVFVP